MGQNWGDGDKEEAAASGASRYADQHDQDVLDTPEPRTLEGSRSGRCG